MVHQLIEWLRHKRFRRNIRHWFRQCGDETLRLDYPLDPTSIVLDVGGFEGNFAAALYARYGCMIHVFEPVPAFFCGLQERFAGNTNIILHPFGLGGRTETVTMSLAANGSSHVKAGGCNQPISAQIRSFEEFMATSNIERIDLMKINIEGAEFDLLDHMLDAGRVKIIQDLQVQFHRFVPDACRRRRAIRRRVAVTHRLSYDYYFVWENWHRKPSA